MIPLSRRKDPTDSCQTGFNWYILVSRWFILSPQQDRCFEAVPQPSVPTLHFSLAAWEWWGSMAEQPGPTWATQDCQLSAVPGPSGTDTTCSFILPPFQLHIRHFPTPAAHWGHSFSRSSGYVEAHSPVLRIAIQKWWSLAVLPVILKLLLGKGRKSQKQICKPNSRRAALRLWKQLDRNEGKRSMPHMWLLHWSAPAEKLPATVIPSVEDTFIQPCVLHLYSKKRMGLEGILVSFTTQLHAWVHVRFWTLPGFFVYYLKQQPLYSPHTKSLPITTTLHRQSHSQLVIADQNQPNPE